MIMAERRGINFLNKDSGRAPEAMIYEFADTKKNTEKSKKEAKGIIIIVVLDVSYLQGELFANILSNTYNQYNKKYIKLDFLVVVPNGKETNTTLSKRRDVAVNNADNLRISIHPYHYFTSNILDHISVGEVKILTEEEKTALLEEHCSTPEQYNTDFVDKVIPVWLGAESGDIIRYSIISRGGIDFNYTRVV
jgi:DNA-directed RNA polymerase subunit H (RpoH/RPB5)